MFQYRTRTRFLMNLFIIKNPQFEYVGVTPVKT